MIRKQTQRAGQQTWNISKRRNCALGNKCCQSQMGLHMARCCCWTHS